MSDPGLLLLRAAAEKDELEYSKLTLRLFMTLETQASTIARLEAENAKLVDLLRVDIITQERDALEAENAAMRSLISSRLDAPQAFWDENRVAMEVARQRAVLAYGEQGTET